jgi:predicted MFS family arabinose efflux permease
MFTATAQTYRNAYSGLSRSTWLLSVVMLINRSGTMVIPFMTLYLTSPKMGYSLGEAGFVYALFGIGAFSGAIIGGLLTDRIGFYPVQLITLMGGGFLFITLGQMHTYTTICIFTYLLSFVNEAFRPANSTAIAFYSREENRTRSYALNRLAINIGWAVGSGIGGILARYNYELLFWVDGITNISAALLMWIFLKPVNYKPEKHKTRETGFVKKSAFGDKNFLGFLLITMVFASCFFQMFSNLPVYFKKDLHFSEPFIGFIMGLNGILIALVEMVMVYKLDGKRKSTAYIVIGVGLVGFSYIFLNLPLLPSLVATGMILLLTFGEMLALPFMNTYWISRTQTYNRGQYAAMYTMAWSAAQTFGPWGGAQLAESFSFQILWWTTGILSLLAAFSFWNLHKRP